MFWISVLPGISPLKMEGPPSRALPRSLVPPIIWHRNRFFRRNLGPYTDIYAMALIGAEMLLGRPVRAGKPPGEILGDELKRPLTLEGEDLEKIPP